MKLLSLLLGIGLTLILSACSKTSPLLKPYPEYIGNWQSSHNMLRIDNNGQVTYRHHDQQDKKTDDSEISLKEQADIKGPLVQFNNHYFQIGRSNLSTLFKIDHAPYQDKGQWKMQVDGHTYIKK